MDDIAKQQQMFNAHLAEKLEKQSARKSGQRVKTQQWHRRYKTEVRPGLVDKYYRRINGFAKKMQDEPVIIQKTHDGGVENALAREHNKSLNITKQNFMFKNSDDWKSIYTPIQRKDREHTMLSLCNETNKLMVLRSIWSQSKYQNQKTQYRFRQKQKQINPPMKYTNKNSNFILNALPKIKNKYKLRFSFTECIQKKKSLTSADSDNDKQQPENLSHTDYIDIISLNNTQTTKRPQQTFIKTEKQLIEEEEMKQLAHKRLYFKSLIDLQQNVKTAKERNQLKQVLVKCGVFKPISGKKYVEQQIDRFLEIVKNKSN